MTSVKERRAGREKTAPTLPRSLREEQLWMVSAITGTEADATAEDVARWVTSGPHLSARDRFEVYRSGYHARLHECLLDDYPVLAAMIGDDTFADLCRAYVDRHPSSSPNLNGFGARVSAFCRESAAGILAHRIAPVLASELAALEWALVEVLHAETTPALDLSPLAALPPDAWASARFIPSAALRMLAFDYPVNEIFIANRIDGLVPPPPAPRRTAVAVYRRDTALWRMDLTPAMHRILGALIGGASMSEALATIEEEVTSQAVLEEVAANVMVWFREWVDAGFFARIELV